MPRVSASSSIDPEAPMRRRSNLTYFRQHLDLLLLKLVFHPDQNSFILLREVMSSVLKGSRRLAPISTHRSGNASSRQTVTTGSQVGSRFSSRAVMLRDCQKSSAES
ncbi:hypothetical protein DY000_02060995 [Brassica cretica]|uniref:Uncharacterized protein n=1 Tax=Brassica cretica TaxID=69181 RepID=A0ABQ7B1A7_BRACR|nr:hypothetical protein DY000_02060995 [Brassica cretica]